MLLLLYYAKKEVGVNLKRKKMDLEVGYVKHALDNLILNADKIECPRKCIKRTRGSKNHKFVTFLRVLVFTCIVCLIKNYIFLSWGVSIFIYSKTKEKTFEYIPAS